MNNKNKNEIIRKKILLLMLVIAISLLHYGIDRSHLHYHPYYSEFYYLPIVLAGLWFGLRGALTVSAAITVCYLPYVFRHWQGGSPYDFDKLVSVGLYNGLAVLVGILRNREMAASERLLQARHLASVGRSLAAVAHDMKTPLVVIGGLTRRVWEKMAADDPAREKLALVIREATRMEEMTKDMLDFSRPLNLHRTYADINKTVRDSLALVADAAKKKKVRIVPELCEGLPNIYFDAMRMVQVIVNLILNAVQASPAGGTVTVRTDRVGENVIVEVIDRGCGIREDQRGRIFDPFFTTKKEGTGLGLPIVRKIVDAHGWTMEILNNRDQGVVSRIMLTVDEEGLPAEPSEEQPPDSREEAGPTHS
ncbi:sensor protein ZraS [bacterium BMS3Abin13]|nr:sensor protein ZraS [bacterium BMS3Abin13]